jgi:hypothetical protein
MKPFRTITITVFLAIVFAPTAAIAIPITPDTFEDGTTQGWVANILNMGVNPAPPTNISSGGPLGAGDNYLQLTAVGGRGNASRLSAINLSQWAGDYIASGITAISMSAINLSTVDLFLRLAFEDPIPGPPMNIAYSSDPIVLPAGGGWTTIAFPVTPAFLTAGLGTVEAALHNTTLIRLYHSQPDNFPNPEFPIPSVTAQLGVDNITATAVPEPATLVLLATGIGAMAAKRRRRGHKSLSEP